MKTNAYTIELKYHNLLYFTAGCANSKSTNNKILTRLQVKIFSKILICIIKRQDAMQGFGLAFIGEKYVYISFMKIILSC